MELIERRPVVSALVALLGGFAIGLFLFGWWLTPVKFTGAGPQDLLPEQQQIYLRALADLYSFDGNQERVRQALSIWPEADQAICQMVQATTDAADASRLTALAALRNNGVGCAPGAAPAASTAEGGGGSALAIILGLAVVLLVLIGVIVVVSRQQRGQTAAAGLGQGPEEEVEALPAPESGEPGVITTPVARFRTTYNRGHDTYDDSFGIENAQGDFLGECGVGISEAIGVDSPKNVTAFEVWLFDKNDIRTVTKVIMSDHAFFDEALKAKLAPKGEPVLARDGETIVLETAALIINANITDMAYGDAEDLPAQSYFDTFTVELSAWAKEGDLPVPDAQGRQDELLSF